MYNFRLELTINTQSSASNLIQVQIKFDVKALLIKFIDREPEVALTT